MAGKSKAHSLPPAGQPSVFDRGITSEVFPVPVPSNHPTLAEACNATLVGQRVFVLGDYWVGSKASEKSVLYECEVKR
jgi:hypothetical protein